MKQTYFIITLIAALTICVLSIYSGITFAQEKNETSGIDDFGLITTTEIDKSMETNNTSSQTANNKSIFEQIFKINLIFSIKLFSFIKYLMKLVENYADNISKIESTIDRRLTCIQLLLLET